jgi:asparagine synthase (glutamine-hydrolysing)
MWAFAWFDSRNGKLLLSRDRFGEKPLYIWKQDDGIYFSSEVKGLIALSGRTPGINKNHLMRSLVNGYRALHQTTETFFEGVEELPSGTSLELGPGTSSIPHPYLSQIASENDAMSYAEAVAGTRERLIDSLSLRMRSDVPVAFAMSGGVDSNSLIATASKVLGADVHGFTITNTDRRYEEKDLVDLAVRKLGIKHTSVALSPKDFLSNLRGLVRSHDGPVATISSYVNWQLMQAISELGYKVTVSGVGADELFTGYYSHHNLYLHEMAKYPELYQEALTAWRTHQAGIVRNPHLQNPSLFIEDPSFRGYINMNSDLFSSYTQMGWKEELSEKTYEKSLLRDRMLNELFAETVPVMLREDDLNAMSFSLENRSPFLDRNLFDWAYTIPSRYLVQDGRAKAVLRDAMRGIVPEPILQSRRKVGFNAPIGDLLDLSNSDVRESILDYSAIFDLVRKDKIEKLLGETAMPNSVSMFLFRFLNAKIFLEEYAETKSSTG